MSYGVDNFMTIGLFYLDVVAAAGSIFSRLATTRIATERSTVSRFLAPRSSASLMRHLFFQRPDEMPRQRVVEWLECVARSHPPAIQRH